MPIHRPQRISEKLLGKEHLDNFLCYALPYSSHEQTIVMKSM
jgi:hypothetical protein